MPPDLSSRLSALERGRHGNAQPDYSALSDSGVALLIRVYEGQPVTAVERAEVRRLDALIGNRSARPWAHLSDAELAERIAQYA